MSKICPATGETVLYLECEECDDKVCKKYRRQSLKQNKEKNKKED